MLTSLLLLALAAPATESASQPNAMREMYDRVAPSLVIVRYTYDGEAGRHEFEGEGCVVDDAGTVICSSSVTPAGIPDAFLKDFKIIIPGDEETELDASLLGRDDRTNLTFIRVNDVSGHKFSPVKFEEGAKSETGQTVYSVGLLPKTSGYKPYISKSIVSTSLRGPVPQVLVNGAGLATIGSPVFDEAGHAIGLVETQQGQVAIFNPDARNDLEAIINPPRVFVPTSDFLNELSHPPTKGQPLAIPWTGIAELNGLTKDVAAYYGLKGQPAVQIGDVIANAPAAQAGLKAGDVIVQYNGQPLERGDSPDEAWMIMTRKISRLNAGDTISLGVINKKGDAPHEVKVTLVERPMPASRAKRFYAEDLGFAVREIVFDDTYERRLPSDTNGVVVGFVKNSSSAAAAHLSAGREGQDLITQFNGEPVKNLEEFKTRYEKLRKDKPKEAIVLEVMRGSNTQVIRIEPPQQ